MNEEDNKYEEEIDLRDYFRVISKRRWAIIAFFLVIVVITTIATFKMTPLYKAETKILLDENKLKVVSFQDVLTTDTTRAQYYTNQQEILTSRSLARRVIEKLKLENSPEFAPEEGANVRVKAFVSWLREKLLPVKKEEIEHSNDPMEETIDAFLTKLNVNFVRNSGVAKVSFYAKDPRIAANVANTLADLYIQMDLERKYGATRKAAVWLDSKLSELKKKLKDSEYALQKYKEKSNIISLEDKQNIIVQKLSELNTALTKAKTERITLETMYNQVLTRDQNDQNGDTIQSIPAVVENDLIQNLKQEYVKLQGQYSTLVSRYGKLHPKMVRLSAQIETTRNKINQEVRKIVGSIKTQYMAAKAKENELTKALQLQKAEALALNKKAIQYGVLKREAESNRDLYDVFLTRLKETDLSKEIQSSNIRILDKAKIPQSPAKPKKKLNIAIAMVVGLMLGLGFAFLGEYMDTSIKTPDELEKQLEIPSIGVVNVADKEDLKEDDLVVLHAAKSRIVEGLLSIRTNVVYSFSDDMSRVLLITSAIPEEGKSFIADNIAISLANLNKDVLLVDADMRRPSLHKKFQIDASPGLSEVLIGEAAVEDTVKDTSVPHLHLLPSGTKPPNPLDLLGSERMEELMEELKKQYAWIIFDTPPLISVADAAMISATGAKVLFVIRSGETKKDAVKQAFKQIENVNAKIIGAVLNFVNFRKERYYYSYYHKYYNYYDEDGTRKRKAKV